MSSFRKLLLSALFVASAVQAAPKEAPTPPPPPMPQAQNVTIFRGRTVEIPLRAIGRAPSQLKFLIRTKPKFGRLGEIQFTGRKTAVVTYYHDEKATATYDSFTYAVQAFDTAVSAPGVVNIAISEEPPALSVIHSLDFGQLWVGETRVEEIVVRNTGGGSLSGRVIVSEPWRIIGSPEYHLARKEESRVRVLFAPADAGEYSVRLMFSHDPRSTVTLSGGAEAPLEFEQAQDIQLTQETGKTSRAGRLRIRNRTSAERAVEITVPDSIEAPEDLLLPANGDAVIEFRTKPDFLTALEDKVVLQSEGYQSNLPLRVFAVPALLRAEPASLDFGTIPTRIPRRMPLTLRNDGGAEARLRVDIPKEVLLIPDPNAAVLAPGEKRSFEVELEIFDSARYDQTVSVRSDKAAPLSIPLSATGISVGTGTGTIPNPTAGETPSRHVLRPETRPATPPKSIEPAEDEASYNSIPPVEKVDFAPISKKALELRWKKPAPNAVSTVVEYRSLGKTATGGMKTLWNKWQGAAFREESGTMIAVLSNLPPGGTWFIRLVSLDETGRRSQPSSILRVTTPNAPAVFWLWWMLGLAVAGGVAYAISFLRRQRQAEDEADAERLEKLGKN